MFNQNFTSLIIAILFMTPNLLFAQAQSPVDLALRHIEKNKKDLNLSSDDIKDFRVSDLYISRHNGVTHVYLNQVSNGVAVRNALINVNILPNGKVINIGNRFVSDLANRVNNNVPAISPADAVQEVINEFDFTTNAPIRLNKEVSNQHFIFDHDNIALEPISVKLVYEIMEDKTVRLAWMVELYQQDAKHWWNARIDAQTGEMLTFHDQIIHCNFDAPDGSCSDASHSHHHATKQKTNTAIPQIGRFNQVASVNSYNVFPIPVQSPSHGVRELIVSPANTTASPFGWHDTDGVGGAEYTITRGNNVHAYQDIFGQNISQGDEPDGGDLLDFDYPLDLGPGLPYTQIDPAITNLFYWNNVIHDVWYQYGFDEASGNFQSNNYGNGGIAGDYVFAEGLDGGGTNNANFGTGADGSSARMQMFIWTNQNLPPAVGDPAVLVVTAPMDQAGDYEMTPGGFGGAFPTPPAAPISGSVVLVDDGTGTTSDACEGIINGADIDGNIAMIDRGDCEFGFKCLAAQNEGAIAVIICNNVAGATIPMAPGAVGDQVTIPVTMATMADCTNFKMALPGGLDVELVGPVIGIPNPGPNGLDGDFDNGIIVHEYGHGISIRLTGGPGTGGCLSNQEQAGEGWSDWFGLVMSTDASNNADENRGMGTYAIGQATTGDGIREFPYSRDMNVDPHTYGDVPNVAVPHGVGSVWCAMIWDLYWNLIDVYGFDDDMYNGTGGNNIAMQLVIDGLKFQACNPSFIDSRDAIVAADEANNNGENVCLIWETFARRGLGFSASAGGNEAFDMPPFCTPIVMTKTAAGDVIAGETLTYTLEITNNQSTILGQNAEVTDEFPTGTSYVNGSLSCANGSVNGNVLTIDVSDLAPNSTLTCTYQLQVALSPSSIVQFTDGVENGVDNWTISSGVGTETWETSTNSYEGDLAWFVPNSGSESDQYLALSDEITLNGSDPALSFWHWYNTEADWDGGVVEVSTDNGASWNDLGNDMVKNGYNGTLEVNPASPISGQDAFNGNSNGYIQTIVDLSDYSGDPIIVRFRLGCDGYVDAEGWYIDKIEFFDNLYFITNTACVAASGNDDSCDEASTVVFGNGTSSTSEIDKDLSVSISPNPNDGIFVLNLNSSINGASTIQVMSVDGKLLDTRSFDRSNGAFEFDLSAYQAGVYLLQIQTPTGRLVEKVIVN